MVEKQLTDTEIAFINETHGHCPLCSEGQLRLGPRGMGSRNMRCDLCDGELNLYLNHHDGIRFVWGGHLIDRDDPSLYSDELLSGIWGRTSG